MKRYIAKDPDKYKGQSVGDGQCVAFVKAASGAPQTKLWKRGDKVHGTDLPEGIAIATLTAEGYPNAPTGNHAAIYVRQDQSGIVVWDQWKNAAETKRVDTRPIAFKGGTTPNSKDADTFFVIEVEDTD